MNARKVKSVYARRKPTQLSKGGGHGPRPLVRGFRASVCYNFELQLDTGACRGLNRRPRVATVPQPLERQIPESNFGNRICWRGCTGVLLVRTGEVVRWSESIGNASNSERWALEGERLKGG